MQQDEISPFSTSIGPVEQVVSRKSLRYTKLFA